ncbi:uncharacterized protein V6R79_024497 [Siganus canaliculatus]
MSEVKVTRILLVDLVSGLVMVFAKPHRDQEPAKASFSVLQDEITSFTSAIRILTRKEGEDVTHECSFFFNGKRRLFCKNTCEGNDVLINTALNFYQRGRYTIRYEEAEGAFSESSLYVSITKLTTSDSGRYRCSTTGDLLPVSLEDFESHVKVLALLHAIYVPQFLNCTRLLDVTQHHLPHGPRHRDSPDLHQSHVKVLALLHVIYVPQFLNCTRLLDLTQRHLPHGPRHRDSPDLHQSLTFLTLLQQLTYFTHDYHGNHGNRTSRAVRERESGRGEFDVKLTMESIVGDGESSRSEALLCPCSSTIRRRNHGADVLLQKHHEFKQDRAVLQDEITSFTSAISILTGKEGEDFTYKCPLFFNGRRRLFCKNTCKGNDVLIDTERDSDQRGRYTIRYEKAKDLTLHSSLYVSITNLTTSDSGRYRCSTTGDWRLDSKDDFELRVEEVPTVPTPTTPGRSSTSSSSASSASTLTTTQSFTWSSSSSPPSSASPKTTEESEQIDTRAGPVVPGLLLYTGLTVVVLSAAVWILIRRRRSKAKEPPHPGKRDSAPVALPLYEDVRDTHSSAAAQTSTVYVCAKYTKADSSGTTGDYSYVTAAGLHTDTEDDSSKLTYSEVVFSGRAAAPNSAPCGAADEVLYSVPRVAASSDRKSSSDVPLYSTVGSRPL